LERGPLHREGRAVVGCRSPRDTRSGVDETPLHVAARYGSDEFAAALISFGAEVDAQDRVGGLPLHLAIAGAQFNVAKVLLQNGAGQGLTNSGGQTPIDAAPAAVANQANAFLLNWEHWDEMVEALESREMEVE